MRWLRAIKAFCLATSLGLYPALDLQLLGFCWVSSDELMSAEFWPSFGLCGQAEHLEGVRVLPLGDEFREEIGFGAIQEKFWQALA